MAKTVGVILGDIYAAWRSRWFRARRPEISNSLRQGKNAG